MEPRVTRQTARDELQGTIQLNDHTKDMRKKKEKSLATKGEKKVSSAMVSLSRHQKRKFDQRIKKPNAKVAKESVPSTKTAKTSVPSTKTKVVKASGSSTKSKEAKASGPSTKTKIAKSSVPSTPTDKKNKRNSKDFSIPRTRQLERGRLSSLQHHRTRKAEENDLKDFKSGSIKAKKNQSAKVERQQRTHLKLTSLTSNRIIRKRSKALKQKRETQREKSNLQKKKLLKTKPLNNSRRPRSTSKEIQFDKVTETTETTSFIRPYLSFDTNLPTLVSNICCVDQHTLWIGRMAYGNILKVTYNSSNILNIVKEFKHPQCEFYDFCYDRNKDQILYTDRRNDSIMSISSNYKLKKFKCLKPLKATCITISPDDFIFFGLVDEYSHHSSPKREIVKMARNGTIIMRIPSIQDNAVRFSIPHRIAIHPNNDIVIESYEINGGGIVIFDSEGQSKHPRTITGPNVRFQPRGLAISRAGDIVVSNEAHGEIYIYDVKGQLLETITSQSIGITDIPWSLAFDNCGHLVIGTMVDNMYQPNVPTICFAEYLYR